MNYIFVSSDKKNLEPLNDVDMKDLKFCIQGQKYLSRVRYLAKSNTRVLDCYSTQPNISERDVKITGNTVYFFHGYLLDEAPFSGAVLRPQNNYYGVYSHGMVCDENCHFASDELGLSPIYYSQQGGYFFVSNNPHLIAAYKMRLGFRIHAEKTLPVWHTIGITIESDVTGYEGIFRVRPWRYISIDCQNQINFPSKNKTEVPEDYDAACESGLEQLRKGMNTIRTKYNKLGAQLTGGMDSRLVLAYIMNAGSQRDFKFITGGAEGNPDITVARMLADKYGLAHSHIPYDVKPKPTEKLDTWVKEICMSNAMETCLVRTSGRQDQWLTPSLDEAILNGMGATFVKSLDDAQIVENNMRKRFKENDIDFEYLTSEQEAYGHICFDFANVSRFFLKEAGLNIANEYRKYIFQYNYRRFPERMNYADAMMTYRYRSHNSNLSTLEKNCIFLYSPILQETSRKLTPKERKDAKLYFDLMWRINPEICFVPLENRKLAPELYTHLPADIRRRFSEVPAISGDITSEEQQSLFNDLLPIMRKDMPDMLPSSVFDYIKSGSIEARLREDIPYGKPVFALVNLYGIAKWHDVIEDLNNKHLTK